MGNTAPTIPSQPAVPPATAQPEKGGSQPSKMAKVGIKSGKRICCCCPDTKQARDACVLNNGEEHPDCLKLIEAHKACLRAEGFDVK